MKLEELRKRYPPGSKLLVKDGVKYSIEGETTDWGGKTIKVGRIYEDRLQHTIYVSDMDSQWEFSWDEIEEFVDVKEVGQKKSEIDRAWTSCLAPRGLFERPW